jgi:hypothetical protein
MSDRGDPRQMDQFVIVDAHVHYHACFDRGMFFDSTACNSRRIAFQSELDRPPSTCLLFADNADQHSLRALANAGPSVDGWRVHGTAEESSLVAKREDFRLYLIAGRQVITAEGIEVLVLASDDRIPDRLSLDETLSAAFHAEAIVALPWGFGKWWFRRGAIVKKAIVAHARGTDGGELYLGDNSGRARLYPDPAMFQLAREMGMRILPGSDPLPIPDHVHTAGRFGCLLQGQFDDQRPAHSVKRHLSENQQQPPTCGWRSGLTKFCRDQMFMQARKFRP